MGSGAGVSSTFSSPVSSATSRISSISSPSCLPSHQISEPAKRCAARSITNEPLPRLALLQSLTRAMAEQTMRPGTAQRPVGLRRAMSAIQRPSSGALGRPASGRPRRPYSAYTRKGAEEEGPKYEAPETNREWWRAYLKVSRARGEQMFIYSLCITSTGDAGPRQL